MVYLEGFTNEEANEIRRLVQFGKIPPLICVEIKETKVDQETKRQLAEQYRQMKAMADKFAEEVEDEEIEEEDDDLDDDDDFDSDLEAEIEAELDAEMYEEDESELVETLRERIEELQKENAELRRRLGE